MFNEIKEREKEKDKEKVVINELEKKSLYLEKKNERPSENKNIILGYDGDPDTIIENILITIFNNINNNIKTDEKYIISCQKKIKELCSKYGNYELIHHLLTNNTKIIKKYKNKIFERMKIKEDFDNDYKKYYFRSKSIDEKYSKIYIHLAKEQFPKRHKSISKEKKTFDDNIEVKYLFNKIKEIRECLKKARPIIEKILESLSKSEKNLIYENEKEDYFRILIHDSFIWDETVKNKNTEFSKIIQEITEGDNIDNKIGFNNYQEEILKIAEIGSSIDERYPEDAILVTEKRYRTKDFYDNSEDENIFSQEQEADEEDMDIDIEDQNIKHNNFANINMIRFNGKNIDNLADSTYSQNVITSSTLNGLNGINNINIKENHKFKEMPNLNKILNKENLNNKLNLNSTISINKITDVNGNSIDNEKQNKKNKLNKEKFFKNPEHLIFKNKKNIINKNKKDNINNKGNKKFLNSNKNLKSDKKEIPSDIDDLVKYIENDNKNETQNKKKKKNKKKAKKKNKNEIEDKKEEVINQEDIKETEEDNEIREIKENFLKNSINRYKIYKIKFKYKPEWLETISKYE